MTGITTGARRGFARAELAAVVLIGAVIVAMALVASSAPRRSARLADDLAKLKRFGEATGAYGADFNDLFWHFSWTPGDCPSQYADLQHASTGLEASANQTIDILRRRAGREDIARISSWVPNISYSHLVLAEYLDDVLPDFGGISSEDKQLMTWAADPKGFDQRKYCPPCPSVAGTNAGKPYPYRSSFQVPPSLWTTPPSGSEAMAQGSTHNTFYVPWGVETGGHALSEIAHPSEKVVMHDQFARHFGPRVAYHAYPEARVAMLMGDGAAGVRMTQDGNKGWNPSSPTSFWPTTYEYRPQAWEPPTMSGREGDYVEGYYRWTRSAIAGRDFGGPEIKP